MDVKRPEKMDITTSGNDFREKWILKGMTLFYKQMDISTSEPS